MKKNDNDNNKFNIINIKEIEKFHKINKKNSKKISNKQLLFLRVYNVSEDKFKNDTINKLNSILKDISNSNNQSLANYKKIDDIIFCFKNYFLNVADRFLDDRYKNTKKNSIEDAMKYSLFSNGKRLRAFLIFFIFYLNDGMHYQNIEAFMLAIEMIHSFSLVHDDLPALDNDTLRRGKATTWKKYGEAQGILSGDALLNISFSMMLDYYIYITSVDLGDFFEIDYKKFHFDKNEHINLLFDDVFEYGYIQNLVKRYVACMGLIISSTGCMIRGEYLDISYTNKVVSKSKLFEMYEFKTAMLIQSAISVGAIMSEIPSSDIELYDKIGQKLGILYQFSDDLLDIVGDEKKIGKPVGSDKKNNKNLLSNNIKDIKKNIKLLENDIFSYIDMLSQLKNDKKQLFKLFIKYLCDREK